MLFNFQIMNNLCYGYSITCSSGMHVCTLSCQKKFWSTFEILNTHRPNPEPALADHKRPSPARSCADRFFGPVRPLEAETPRKPKTTNSGGTPELADLGLSWSRQVTQNALERRRNERRTARGWKN